MPIAALSGMIFDHAGDPAPVDRTPRERFAPLGYRVRKA